MGIGRIIAVGLDSAWCHLNRYVSTHKEDHDMLHSLQPFLPTKDYAISRSFYQKIGFSIVYEDASLCLFEQNQVRFFIQRAYLKEWAENLMIQMYVSDLQDWHRRLIGEQTAFPMIVVGTIRSAHYGKTFTLIDPAGVLWHWTDPTIKPSPEQTHDDAFGETKS
jgi:hypothetical protein